MGQTAARADAVGDTAEHRAGTDPEHEGPANRPGGMPDEVLARVVTDDTAAAAIVGPDFTICYANDACRRYGWDPEAIVGQNALEWIHPDDMPRAIAAAKAVPAQAGFGTSPFRFRLADGSYESLDVASVIISDDQDSGYLAFSMRPNPFDHARTRAYQLMVAGAPPEESLAGLGAHFSPSRPASLIAFDGVGRRFAIGDLDPVLGGIFDGRQDHTPDAPWTIALEELTAVTITSTEGLPEATRARAAALGLHGAAFVGAPDPGRPQGALLSTWCDEADITSLLSVNLGDIQSVVRLALDRRASSERLEHLAHHDALTGLSNRARYFALLDAAVRGGAPLAVAYLDLDGFKGANDRFGHAAGDEVLVELARRFAREMRAGDVVARLGGDEFAVLIAEPPDESAAAAVVGRLLAAARTPIDLSTGDTVTLGASAGLVVVADPTSATPDALVHQADTALYQAKRGAKGTLIIAHDAPAGGRRHDD